MDIEVEQTFLVLLNEIAVRVQKSNNCLKESVPDVFDLLRCKSLPVLCLSHLSKIRGQMVQDSLSQFTTLRIWQHDLNLVPLLLDFLLFQSGASLELELLIVLNKSVFVLATFFLCQINQKRRELELVTTNDPHSILDVFSENAIEDWTHSDDMLEFIVIIILSIVVVHTWSRDGVHKWVD